MRISCGHVTDTEKIHKLLRVCNYIGLKWAVLIIAAHQISVVCAAKDLDGVFCRNIILCVFVRKHVVINDK